MQGDGNAVVYDASNRAMWDSRTAGRPGSILRVQDDGNVAIYAPGNRAVWATGTGVPETLLQRASRYWSAPLAQFLAYKASGMAGQLPPVTWTDDGCSKSPDDFLFAFKKACSRHDFGYRNFGSDLQLDPTAARRRQVDGKFKEDLYNVCSSYTGWRNGLK